MKSIGERVQDVIWRVDVAELPAVRAWGIRALRILHALVNDLLEGQLTLRAMSLVYTTLLSLVPVLAVSFSVLKGFGVHNQIEPLLLGFLAPLGEKGNEITGNVIGFVDNMRVGVLGSLGLAMLLYTVVSLIQKIERAFNYTWHTQQSRSLGQRFSNYLSVVLVGPVLMFAAMGLTASLASATLVQRLAEVPGLGALVRLAGQLVPYGLIVAAFTFVYRFVPNARVRFGPALVGALVAGFLWETLGFGFASVVASSTRYTAIYSGFAVLILFLMWLYLSWLILLVGASIAFYVQHPRQLHPHRGERALSGRTRERLALLLMTRIGRDHFEGGTPPTLEQLAGWSGVAADLVAPLLAALERRGLLVQTSSPDGAFAPGRAPERVTLAEILEAVRTAEESRELTPWRLPHDPVVDETLAALEAAVAGSLQRRTLRELVLARERAPAGEGGRPPAQTGP